MPKVRLDKETANKITIIRSGPDYQTLMKRLSLMEKHKNVQDYLVTPRQL